MVLPALNLSTLDAGILISSRCPPEIRGDYGETFLLFKYYCGTPPSCLKVYGWWVAYSILVSAPVPLGFRSYWDLVGVGPRGFWD